MYRSAATRFQCTMKSKITQITVILFAMLKVSVFSKQTFVYTVCNTEKSKTNNNSVFFKCRGLITVKFLLRFAVCEKKTMEKNEYILFCVHTHSVRTGHAFKAKNLITCCWAYGMDFKYQIRSISKIEIDDTAIAAFECLNLTRWHRSQHFFSCSIRFEIQIPNTSWVQNV